MFTGIIRELGTVTRVERSQGLVRLSLQAPKIIASVGVLESVSVNGVCLSIVATRDGRMSFEIIRETQRLTTLGTLRAGDRVNLEPSLSLVDRLSGHFVLGHVDGVGAVIRRRDLPGETILTIRMAPALGKFLVPKAPVAIDGVSLTVGSTLSASTFTVHLIPETMRQTTLGSRSIGEGVNVELDYIAKLVAHYSNCKDR